MRRFFAPELPAVGESIRLNDDVSHHLLRVAGIAQGEVVELFDGQGGSCVVILEAVEGGRAVMRGELLKQNTAPSTETWLLQSVLRPGPFDRVIRMATEMGVGHIVPVRTERCVALGDRLERWQRIARSAAGQCGRSDVPQIHSLVGLQDALGALPPGTSGRVYVVGSEPAPRPVAGPVAVLLGPAGGLTDDEIAIAERCDFCRDGLGARTLRADTAAVVALARVSVGDG